MIKAARFFRSVLPFALTWAVFGAGFWLIGSAVASVTHLEWVSMTGSTFGRAIWAIGMA